MTEKALRKLQIQTQNGQKKGKIRNPFDAMRDKRGREVYERQLTAAATIPDYANAFGLQHP